MKDLSPVQRIKKGVRRTQSFDDAAPLKFFSSPKLRRKLKRAVSRDARGVNMHSSKQPEADAMNVFACEGLVSLATVKTKLEDVARDDHIVNLEIEDLVVSRSHHGLFPAVQDLVFTSSREWKSFQFVDSFDGRRFPQWQETRRMQMQGYERAPLCVREATTWKACVELQPGIPVADVLSLFRIIVADESVVDFTFGNSSVDGPKDLSALFHFTDNRWSLRSSLVLEVSCGWAVARSENHVALVNKSIVNLSNLGKDFLHKEKQNRANRARSPSNKTSTKTVGSQSPVSRRGQRSRSRSPVRCPHFSRAQRVQLINNVGGDDDELSDVPLSTETMSTPQASTNEGAKLSPKQSASAKASESPTVPVTATTDNEKLEAKAQRSPADYNWTTHGPHYDWKAGTYLGNVSTAAAYLLIP